jgi:hypothetical protein
MERLRGSARTPSIARKLIPAIQVLALDALQARTREPY